MDRRRAWTKEELEILHSDLSVAEVSRLTGRSKPSIRNRRARDRMTPAEREAYRADMRVYAKTRHRSLKDTALNDGRAWTAEEDEYIIDHADQTVDRLARKLGRSYSSVTNRRIYLRAHGRI